MVGWPAGVPFQDPSNLTMARLLLVEAAMNDGSCYFKALNRDEDDEMSKRGRKGRKDKFNCRGRQKCPAKPRKKGKTGKQILTAEELTEEQVRLYG